jgi:type 1 glutamine amidotransferase
MTTALVVRGGWTGHSPVEATDRYAEILRRDGYRVTTSDSLDSYLDHELLRGTDLIVQCWTMGTIEADQLAGLSAAIRAGTGFAGWHGGMIDAFRTEPAYQLITGGQFVHHPKGFVDYQVRPVGTHPVVAGLGTFAVHTEQYYVHVDPTINVHAVTDFVDDPDLPGAAGTTMPVAWTKKWGAGRVFVTTLGHRMADFDVPETDTLITRGLAWASR